MKKILLAMLLLLLGTAVQRQAVPAFAGRSEQAQRQKVDPGAGSTGEARGNQALAGVINENLPDQLRSLWSFKAGDEIKASPVVSGNTVVFGCLDGFVYALDLNGKLIWKVNTGNGIEASALILNHTVYVGNLNGTLYAFNLADGREIWHYQTEGQISGSANWWKSGNTVHLLVGSYDYNLHCVDAATGKGVWKYESDNFINGSAACMNGTAIFGGCDGYLHVVDILTGKLSVKINVATYVPGSAPTSEALTFVGDYDGGFSCVSISEQKIIWKYSNDKVQLPFVASAAVSGDRVVTGSRDKHVYCFGKKDGELIWKYSTGEKVDASPLICREKILIANMRGDLIILKLSDGAPVLTYELGTPVFSNPAVAGGKIYVAGQDGTVWCLGK